LGGMLAYQREARVWAIASASRLVLHALTALQDLQSNPETQRRSHAPGSEGLPPGREDAATPVHRTVQLHLSEPIALGGGIAYQRVVGRIAEHWRRAHWRHQPCGPGGHDRRLVRIREAHVGAGALRSSSHRYVLLP
jgi:hypothetical protein